MSQKNKNSYHTNRFQENLVWFHSDHRRHMQPLQFLLSRLSFLRTTPRQRYQAKILILKGTLRFLVILRRNWQLELIRVYKKTQTTNQVGPHDVSEQAEA